ncbi:MAG: hypothetical protein ACFB16_14375 [Phormidesmis sp.]
MSEDPISKSGLNKRIKDPIAVPKGKGSIDVSRDYSSSLSLRARIIFSAFCVAPYVAICVFVYLEGVKGAAIVLLAVPIVFFFIFWYLNNNFKT